MKIIDADRERALVGFQCAGQQVAASARRQSRSVADNVLELAGELDSAGLDCREQMRQEARIVVVRGVETQPGGRLPAANALVALTQEACLAETGGRLDRG